MKQESPGLWASSVSGHVDAGESYDEACIREIEEEVGLKIDETPKKLFKMEEFTLNFSSSSSDNDLTILKDDNSITKMALIHLKIAKYTVISNKS